MTGPIMSAKGVRKLAQDAERGGTVGTARGTPKPDKRRAAYRRMADAKQKMSRAQAALNKAENEWHEACLEYDRL